MGGVAGGWSSSKKKNSKVCGGVGPAGLGTMYAVFAGVQKTIADLLSILGSRLRRTQQVPNTVAELGDGH